MDGSKPGLKAHGEPQRCSEAQRRTEAEAGPLGNQVPRQEQNWGLPLPPRASLNPETLLKVSCHWVLFLGLYGAELPLSWRLHGSN